MREHTTGLGPVLDGMGLNNGIGSYGNRVTFCFTADRKALPDPEVYEQCLSDAVEELLVAARAKVQAEPAVAAPAVAAATKKAPAKKTPAKAAAVKKAPVKKAPVKKAPSSS